MDFIRGSFHGSGQQPTQEGHERRQEGDRRTPDTGPPKDGTETGRSNTWGPQQRTATNNHAEPERVYVFNAESSPSRLEREILERREMERGTFSQLETRPGLSTFPLGSGYFP